MFGKMLKSEKKKLAKQKKDALAALSQEHRDYLEMQDKNKEAAEECVKKFMKDINALGFMQRPIIRHFDPNQPGIVGSDVIFTKLPYDLYRESQGLPPEGQVAEAAVGEGENSDTTPTEGKCCDNGDFGSDHDCLKQPGDVNAEEDGESSEEHAGDTGRT